MLIYLRVKIRPICAKTQSNCMVSSGTTRFLHSTGMAFLPLLAALTLLAPVRTQAQEASSASTASNQAQTVDLTDQNQLRPLTQDSSLLSLQGGQRLMTEGTKAVAAQNYALATKQFQDARQVFNQLSNFYQELSASFAGIDNRIADLQRRKAVETAQMRDDATFQLALVHRAQNQPELAIPLLIQTVRSQNPTRELGKKAYQLLFELGFVDSPYPKPTDATATSSNPSAANAAATSSNPPATPNNGLLSLQGGQGLMTEASSAVESQNYTLAAKKLQEARQLFNQLSNFYQDLGASFAGIDNQIADAQKKKAVDMAQMRDEATYQLALVHRAQNQPELAVPLLIQIVRSQNPTRELGKKAYQQMFELGFVDSPYPRSGDRPSTSSNPPNSGNSLTNQQSP